ncbi:sigma-70 family RNA polymerase sigma factor [Enterococcus gallinarum]|uniref:sigma-70 family RNA polymerase sigma factor n=1 Tax=Enterococcus gallinarum TaxID=1353 RepID=UPI0018A9D997|nr:sigma-70 family RNA polymerase sigma factor [Enterococcus gallinarum]
MKTESEITYIFIRYVTVTLKRQANAFYKRQGRIFSNESQLLIDSKEITEQLLLQQVHSSTPDILLERQFLNEQLLLSLFQLTDEQIFIMKEKHLKKQSDAEIGRKLHCSSQAVSKKKRTIYTKLRKFFSP